MRGKIHRNNINTSHAQKVLNATKIILIKRYANSNSKKNTFEKMNTSRIRKISWKKYLLSIAM